MESAIGLLVFVSVAFVLLVLLPLVARHPPLQKQSEDAWSRVAQRTGLVSGTREWRAGPPNLTGSYRGRAAFCRLEGGDDALSPDYRSVHDYVLLGLTVRVPPVLFLELSHHTERWNERMRRIGLSGERLEYFMFGDQELDRRIAAKHRPPTFAPLLLARTPLRQRLLEFQDYLDLRLADSSLRSSLFGALDAERIASYFDFMSGVADDIEQVAADVPL